MAFGLDVVENQVPRYLKEVSDFVEVMTVLSKVISARVVMVLVSRVDLMGFTFMLLYF